jgi:hypothetical protein
MAWSTSSGIRFFGHARQNPASLPMKKILLFLIFLAVCGRAIGQEVTLSPPVVAFGNQSVNAYSMPILVRLTNSGNANLRIFSITVSSGFGTVFNWSSTVDCQSAGAPVGSLSTIPAGASCIIGVDFQPTLLKGYAGRVTIVDNARGSPHSVRLSGTGTAQSSKGLNRQWIAFNRGGAPSASQQCLLPRNVTAGGGALILTAQRKNATCASVDFPTASSYAYTSAEIAMKTFNFLYGTVEFRGKFGGGAKSGSWPAVWLYDASCQNSDPTGTDNNCTAEEIDITEILFGNFTQVGQYLHMPNLKYNNNCNALVTDVGLNYHTYDLVWAPGSLVWKIDGTTTCTMTSKVPSHSMYLKVDVFVGGNSGGTINNATFPWTTTIQYVSVTQNGTKIFYDNFSLGMPLRNIKSTTFPVD